MAVAMDIGEKADVHPHNKQELGARLSRIARARAYNEPIEFSGPMYESMAIENQSIRIRFTHIGGGLTAKGDELKWFQIAGEDHKFVDAVAKIEGQQIVVSSPDVVAPRALRYAKARFPEGANLYNTIGLPAPQFRTDDWSEPTKN